MTNGFDNPDGVKLIETLRWDGAGLQRLALHLARLEGAARRLGFACDPAAAEAALRGAAPAGQEARMRLTLDAAGGIEVTAAAVPAAPARWRLGLAGARLRSDDPWLTVKSTRRAPYDTARRLLSDTLDEAIFLNERDEVCDGTITTLFFDRGDGLRTPPLRCGLLPGVLRAGLLARGHVQEEVLHAQDLAGVRLWVGNSLRGLFPADWCG